MLQTVQRCVVVMVVAVLAGACSMHHKPMDETDMPDGKVCGGIQGLSCDDGQFCEFEPDNCQSADLQGTCVEIPEVCTQEYRPVCGCDGETYGNDCQRRAAAVQKDHDGECRE